jgi:hypothetical protein
METDVNNVRKFAAEHEITEEAAIGKGLQQKEASLTKPKQKSSPGHKAA